MIKAYGTLLTEPLLSAESFLQGNAIINRVDASV